MIRPVVHNREKTLLAIEQEKLLAESRNFDKQGGHLIKYTQLRSRLIYTYKNHTKGEFVLTPLEPLYTDPSSKRFVVQKTNLQDEENRDTKGQAGETTLGNLGRERKKK